MAASSNVFNATYYLTTNTDVFNAIISGAFANYATIIDPVTGVACQSAAEAHYVLYGQKEGRQPNAEFNQSYYLLNNPDVLAAVVAGKTTAFQQYVTYGVKEGRAGTAADATFDANFSGAKYLAANPDVAAAGFTASNAILHYLQYGEAEGRSAYNAAGAVITVANSSGIVPVTTQNLTTNVDSVSLSTSNNTVNGTINGGTATYTAGDSITGAVGTSGNTLSISDATGAGITTATSTGGITVSGIQTLNLVSGAAVTGVNTASSIEGFSGLTQISIKDVGGTTVTAAATTSIGVTDLVQAAAAENVQGGQNVSVVTTGQTTGTITIGAAATAPAGTIAVSASQTLANAVGGAIAVTGGTVDTISVIATSTTANTASTTSAVTVTGSAATTSVAITESAPITIGLLVGGLSNGAISISDKNAASTTVANTITTVALDNFGGGATISDNALTTLTLADKNGGLAITSAAVGVGSATLTETLNNLSAGTVTDTNNEITTLNIIGATGSKGSSQTFADTGLKTVTISGAGTLTESFAANTALTSVTDTLAGASTLTIGSGVSFNGAGSGQDILILSGVTTGTIAGGSATNNEIVASIAGTGVTSLGTVTGFTILGFNSGSSGTFDLSKLTGYTAIDDQGGNSVNVIKATPGSSVAIDANTTTLNYNVSDTTGGSDAVTVTLGLATGTGVTVGGLELGDATATPLGIGTVTFASTYTGVGYVNNITNLENAGGGSLAIGATSGISTLNVTGNAGLAIAAWQDGVTNLTINNSTTSTVSDSFTLTDNNLTSFTYTGSTTGLGSVTITDGITTSLTVADSAGASALSLTLPTMAAASFAVSNVGPAVETIAAFTDANLTALTLSGTGGLTFASVTDSVAGTLTIADNATGAATISTLVAAGNITVNDTTAATLTIAGTGTSTIAGTADILNNTGSSVLTFGTSTSAIQFTGAATTLTVAGAVTGFLFDNTNTLTVAGSGDNSAVNLTITHTGKNDIVTLGNGNDKVTDSTGATADTIFVTIGTGSNTVSFGAGHTGVDTLTFATANGASTTAYTTLTNAYGAGAAADTITFKALAVANTINTIAGVTSLAQGVASSQAAPTFGIDVFAFSGNTYVYENTGTVATSELVQLTGAGHTFTVATTGGATVLTLTA